MSCLIYDMLDLSQIRCGTFKIKNSRFDVRELMRGITKYAEIQTMQKGISFRLQIDDQIPESIEGDQQRLKQVVMNIVGNAIKYTSKGTIQVSIKLDPEYLNI